MADPTLTLNRKMTDPSLSDLLNMAKKDIMLSLNCHAIATVQSFNPDNQTITATINYKKSYFRSDENGIYKMTLVDYPLLLDVPVLILGGGAAQITFPIAQGDECLILFNDRDIDNWFQSGQVTGVASGRLHSFSDGLAFVGLRSLARSISNYDATRAVLANGTTLVGVGADKVKIANVGTTLNTLLQNLLSEIQALTVLCTTPGNPSSPPVNSAAFAAIATQIAGLLE